MAKRQFALMMDGRRARREGAPGLARRQAERLAEAVAHAREHSAYYRELYAGLPERVEDPRLLPVTDKRRLMARFDDWVTDPEVTLAGVEEFVADPERAGERFLGRYQVSTTSGTTGNRGIFVMSADEQETVGAMVGRQLFGAMPAKVIWRMIAGGGRSAKILATGGHFLAYATARNQALTNPGAAKVVRLMSVQSPIPELVTELNEFDPVVLDSYASVAALLATEKEAGRLRIRPAIISLSSEGLPPSEYARIAAAFDARVYNSYGCNEAVSVGSECAEGWLHAYDDWLVVEPVDADHRPTPPGELSHTVLLSVLFRRLQPILRYDLGDSVVVRPDPCPCGNPCTAFRLRGRASDVLTFSTPDGGSVQVAPLVFETAVERVGGIELFQVAQTATNRLEVRFVAAGSADRESLRTRLRAEFDGVLETQGLEHVGFVIADEPPVQAPGGKFRTVIPYAGNEPGPKTG